MTTPHPIYLKLKSSAPTSTEYPSRPSTSEIRAFHSQIPRYSETRLVPLPDLARDLGVRAVFVKEESNRCGLPSFKILGASWGIHCTLTQHLGIPRTTSFDELCQRVKGSEVVLFAATDGNHGRAVARIAKLLSLPCHIFVPRAMDKATQDRIEAEGAEVLVQDADYDQTVEAAAAAANSHGRGILIQDTTFAGYEEIPGWIVDGYSTMLDEIDYQLKQRHLECTAVVTPVGVGSLAHAVVRHFKSPERSVQVIAVEADTAACLYESLRAGKRVSVETGPTIMDGLNCGTVSCSAWHDLQRCVDASITVSSLESHCAVEYLASEGVEAGPCGAATLAGLRRLVTENDNHSSLIINTSVVVLLSTEGPREYTLPDQGI